jgi:lipopolysaccharide assembly outer membrane protein LptD (OstA)
LLINVDSLSAKQFVLTDTLAAIDTIPEEIKLLNLKNDSIKKSSDKGGLDAKVVYNAADSMRFDIALQKLYLFGQAEVIYESTTLNANYIELDLKTNQVYACGTLDSNNILTGKPQFSDGGQNFSSHTMLYNFDTKKGKITKAITQEGEGYIHGEAIKIVTDDVFFIKKGKYTTCNNETPHFHIEASKLKFIKDDKIVTGPAYMVVEEIPTPLAVPFGFFPNKEEKTSGLLFPTYGQSPGLGYFLNDIGYYWAINDYVDLAITADIYSRLSWGLKLSSQYNIRYRFNGDIDLSYSKFRRGEQGFDDYQVSNNFFVRWKHVQDAKARPGMRFSADVNAGSANNFQNNFNTSVNDYLSNTFASNISYSKSWAGKPYNFSINARHNQNRLDSSIVINFPSAAFNVTRINPFKRKVKVGANKWYEDIGISYQGLLANELKTKESLLVNNFDSAMKLMKNGIQHVIPITTSIKLFKYISFNPNFTYNERWYMSRTEKNWDYGYKYSNESGWYRDTVKTEVVQQVNGFTRAGNYTLSSQLSTVIYGMYTFKSKKIKAIRHMMSPAASFSFAPDYSQSKYGYFKTYQRENLDGSTQDIVYSIFDGQIHGGPAGKSGAGNVGLSIVNNLEMKVKTEKDSITSDKKIKLIENLTARTNYNIFADSLNWTPINISGFTTLFKNVTLNVISNFDPYAIALDKNDRPIKYNTAHYNATGKLARLTTLDVSLSFRLKSKNVDQQKKNSQFGTQQQLDHINQFPDAYVDFSIPWSLNVAYNYNYSKAFFDPIIRNAVTFSGDLSLTTNWKIGFRSGYDFVAKEATLTSIDIYRDLHCWEMAFNVIPFGNRKSYNITLNVKSSILQDLRLNRTRNWYDFQ